MPSKEEKERRRQIMNALQKRDEEEFEKSLPMGRQVFKELFDHLDLEFGEQGCDHT